jgi:predicted dehydrogenase
LDKKIKWGIIGLGKIAHKFAQDLVLVSESELAVVASRSLTKAKTFAATYNANNCYGSYEELLRDSNADIVYIATPNNTHESITILALEYKKAVLCEKPFAINKTQVLKMISASKKHGVFLMEAMWSRFIPAIRNIKNAVERGELGEIKYINADFSFNVDPSIQRVYDKKLGGGSLLDIGIYPIFLAYLLVGMPTKISANAHYFESGADSQLAMIFNYGNAQALLFSSFNSFSKRTAKISGTLGEIIMDEPWNETDSFSIQNGNDTSIISLPTLGRGYTYEIMECNSCLKNDVIESNLWSHQNSIELITLLDRVRKEINLSYSEDTL